MVWSRGLWLGVKNERLCVGFKVWFMAVGLTAVSLGCGARALLQRANSQLSTEPRALKYIYTV